MAQVDDDVSFGERFGDSASERHEASLMVCALGRLILSFPPRFRMEGGW
jgi:hypothetical protein